MLFSSVGQHVGQVPVKHGNINMYDLQNLPAFVFLVKGITPHIFVGWDGLVSEEIQKRNNLSRGRGGSSGGLPDLLTPGTPLQSESEENSCMSDVEIGSGSQSGSMSISGSLINDSGRDPCVGLLVEIGGLMPKIPARSPHNRRNFIQ